MFLGRACPSPEQPNARAGLLQAPLRSGALHRGLRPRPPYPSRRSVNPENWSAQNNGTPKFLSALWSALSDPYHLILAARLY